MSDFWGVVVGAGGLDGNGVCGVGMMGMGKYEGCMRDVKRDVIGKYGVWEVR